MNGPADETLPNVYVLVVGPPGHAEKTRTVKVGTRILMEVAPHLRGSDPTAEESLLKSLQVNPSQIWVYPELAGFLSKTAGLDSRGRGIRDGFMEIFDGEDKNRVYSRGPKVEVSQPRPNFLGACTPRHLEDYTSGMDWEGGFMSRFLIFSGKKERELAWARQDEEMKKLREFLSGWLAWSSSLGAQGAGENLGCSGNSLRRWQQWKKEFHAKYVKQATNPILQGTIARTELMAAKCALLVAWSCGSCVEPWTLRSEALEAGIAIATLTLEGTLELAANIAPTPEMREQRCFYNAVGSEWTALGDILREANLTKRKGSVYVETLMEQGVIQTVSQNGTSYYKRSSAGTAPYDYSLENLPPPPIPGGNS
jgi:hypothetical protein